MTKKFAAFILLIMIFGVTNAQKGDNAVSVNAEAGIPIYQNEYGFGFFMKGLYGIGRSAQLTLSGGISIFRPADIIEHGDVTTRLVPFLIGYRQNIHHFFIEPQFGLGEMGGKISIEGDFIRPSVAAVFGAISAGYSFKRFNAGIRFQTAHGVEGSSAGTWHDRDFHYTSVFVGYNIFSKRSR